MPSRYDNFVHRENIKHFEEKLGTETDPERRDLLLKLLSEEMAGRFLATAPDRQPLP